MLQWTVHVPHATIPVSPSRCTSLRIEVCVLHVDMLSVFGSLLLSLVTCYGFTPAAPTSGVIERPIIVFVCREVVVMHVARAFSFAVLRRHACRSRCECGCGCRRGFGCARVWGCVWVRAEGTKGAEANVYAGCRPRGQADRAWALDLNPRSIRNPLDCLRPGALTSPGPAAVSSMSSPGWLVPLAFRPAGKAPGYPNFRISTDTFDSPPFFYPDAGYLVL